MLTPRYFILIIGCLLTTALATTTYSSPPIDIAPSTPPATSTSLLSILPNIQGFGTTTVAGSGRHTVPPRTLVIRVQSLEDSGPGSLRACINAQGARTCIFEVSGEIALKSALRVRHPYLTVAGQTAPKPGITITRGGFNIETHDVLLQHLAIRPGDSKTGVPARYRDGVSIGAPLPRKAFNIVLDHLSLTWAVDENLSTAYEGTHDVTIAHSLIAEGLHKSIHPKGPHSKGVMIGNNSQRISLYRNTIAANEERNPYIKPGSSVEMINNLVYGWGPRGAWSLCNLSNNDGTSDPVRLTFIGNVYIPGPWSFIAPPIFASVLSTASKIYVEDNHLVTPEYNRSEPWSIASLDEETFRADSPPVQSIRLPILPSDTLQNEILQHVGSRPAQRDPIDRRIVGEILRRQGAIKDCVQGCRHAARPTPNLTRRVRHLRLPRNPFADTNQDGYTNLENWLHKIERRVTF